MVKNNNGWLWTAIIMIVLNVILLGYIFLGSGVSLSPTTGNFSGCLDSDANTFCAIGDAQNPAALQMHTSRIRDLNNGKVEILAGAGKVVNIAGLDASGDPSKIVPTSVEVRGNLNVSGSLKADNIYTKAEIDAMLSSNIDSCKPTVSGWTPNEYIKIKNNGNNIIQLEAPIKNGVATIDLLYGDGQKFTGIGRGAINRLRTSNTARIFYNLTTDEYFVASWSSGTIAESYLLRATTRTSSGINYTTIKDGLTGTQYCNPDLQPGMTCAIGNVVLTVNKIYISGPDNVVDFSINSNGRFDKLYTKFGGTIYLPVGDLTQNPINNYNIIFKEKQDSGAVDFGNGINLVASWTTGATTTISAISPIGNQFLCGPTGQEQGTSFVFENYINSIYQTRSLYHTEGFQRWVELYRWN